MRALWSVDPPQQTDSFLAADSSVVWTLENSPDWSERLHFPNLQGHRHEGASREPLFVSEGESQSTGGRGRGGGGWRPPAFDQFASYSFAEVFFFHANGKSSNKCAEIRLFGICPNRWCFLTWERSQPRTCLKSAPPPQSPPTHLSESQSGEQHTQRPGVDGALSVPEFPTRQGLCTFARVHIDSQLRD